MPKRRFWRLIFIYIIAFLVLWNFIIPIVFRKKLQQIMFCSQVPIWHLTVALGDLQKNVVAYTRSKSWWIDQTKELMRENAYLRLKIAEQQEQITLSQHILQLNEMSLGDDFKCIPARILYRSHETWSQFFIINRGLKDGVRVGQGVVCTQGIVGYIQQARDRNATVELVAHPNFRLLVALEDDAVPYILRGTFQQKSGQPYKSVIENLSGKMDKNFQKKVKTLRLGHQFPAGIYIGQCVEIRQQDQQIIGIVQLGEYLNELDTVGVLVPFIDL